MTESVQINLIQDSFLVGDIQANTRKIITLAERARQSGADLVLFPELALTGYPPEDLLLRQGFINQIDAAVSKIIAAVTDIDIIFGAIRHDGQQLYNSAFWGRGGKLIDVYDKYTLPNYAVFDEKRYFSSGERPVVIELKGIKIGLSICEDVWTKAPSYQAQQAGAQALLILNASPYHCYRNKQRIGVLKQRNAETGMALFYLNIVGGQDELVFDGESLVIDANGELMGRGPDFEAAQLQYRLHATGSINPLILISINHHLKKPMFTKHW